MTPEEVAARLAIAELELQTKGASEADARAATRRAVRYAGAIAGRLPDDMQPRAFDHLLDQELRDAEGWLQGVEAARARGDYRDGMERAVRDGRWERGLRRAGVEPGPERTSAWRESVDGATDAWTG